MIETPINSTIITMDRQRKVLIVAAVAIAILTITTFAAVTAAIIAINRPKPLPVVAPVTDQATPAAILNLPTSRFASDAGILELRQQVTTISGQIDSVDLFEAEITPPNLDLNLNIAPQR